MTQTQNLIQALKQVLHSQRITYARVAEHLGISEASVKRMFSKCSFTLDRLEAICDLAGIRFSELASMTETQHQPLTQLTPEQEYELLGDDLLLLTTYMVLNGWTIEKIIEKFSVTEMDIIKRLAKLDRLGMIELLPENRIRRLVARNFTWRKNGPVQQYFESQVKKDFLDSRFNGQDEHLRFVGGLLSNESILRMHQAIDAITAQLDQFLQADSDLPVDSKQGVGAVFAIRPWELPAFRKLKRNPAK